MNIKNSKKVSSLKFLVAIAAGSLFLNTTAFADEEFYGTIDSLPSGNIGVWMVKGQKVEVTSKTDLDIDHGPLAVGSCVEVEHTNGVAEEIETEKPAKCGKK